MKLSILAVGRVKEAWVREGCDEYARRITRHLPLEVTELRDDDQLIARLPARGRIVALDERGDQDTSMALADRLRRWMGSSTPQVALLIGGADGLPRAASERADERLGLSRLTLPHRLARLILLEQLYRALSIVRGEPYHRS